MEIDNFKVYDLPESITAAGLPMKAEYDAQDFKDEAGMIGPHCGTGTVEKSDTFQRAARLAANLPGTGHNNFLSGILVSAKEYLAAIIAKNPAFGKLNAEPITLSAGSLRALILHAYETGEKHGREQEKNLHKIEDLFSEIFRR